MTLQQNAKNILKWTAVSLFVAWLFFVLGAHYVAQKPFDPAMLATGIQWPSFTFSGRAVGRSLLDVAVAAWLALAGLGSGLWFWRWLGLQSDSRLEQGLFAIGLGLSAPGLVVLVLGLAGWLTRPFLFAITLLFSAAAVPALIPYLRHIQLRLPAKSITLYLLLTFGLALTLALAPPVAWDSLSYHLRGPQLYLQAGRIYPGIDVFSLNNPFLLEMLFMLGMALRSDAVAQLIHFLFAILLAAAVYRIAVRFVKVRQGWTAVLLLLSTPMVMQLAAWPYNDLALAFFTLMAFIAYFHWRETGNGRWLILSGLFAGLTMSLKYTSFLVPLFLALAAAWHLRPKPQAILRAWLQFSLPALAVSIIWYIKNWAFTGNPVYPFVFGGALWSDFRTLTHSDPGSGLGWNLLNLLRIPYDLTLGIRDISGDGPIGPMYLAFLPLLLFYLLSRRFRRAPEAVRLLLAFFGVEMVFWTLGVINSQNLYQGRLLLPALAALCPVLAWVWADLRQWDHPQFSLHDFLRLLLAVVLLLGLAAQLGAWWQANPLPYVAGTQSREAYWRAQLGVLAAASLEMGEYVPETAVIQFFYEPRTYLCRELACRGDHILDKYAVLEHEYHQADAMAAALAEEGVTHILLFQAGLAFLQNDDVHWILPVDTAVYDDFFHNHTRLVHNWQDTYLLYELIP
jgi:4-amino-4-deoxy-L-arabinose transferase-like glycosyltransferase